MAIECFSIGTTDVFSVIVLLDESYGDDCKLQQNISDVRNTINLIKQDMDQRYNHGYELGE